MVDDLTTLSKLGDPSRELDVVPVDLRWLVTSVVEQSTLAAGQRDIKLVCDLPSLRSSCSATRPLSRAWSPTW